MSIELVVLEAEGPACDDVARLDDVLEVVHAGALQHDLEALLAGHVLLRMRNVVITPHSACNTTEAVQRIVDTTIDNIAAHAGGSPRNVVAGPGSD